MTTISFDETIDISKNHFDTLEEFQLFIVEKLQSSRLSTEHKKVLDKRLDDLEQNPTDFISLKQLASSLKRK